MELDVAQLVLLAPGEGESVSDDPDHTVRLLFSHDLLDVTWSHFGRGERGAEPHVHREHTDSFYVLEGELTFRIGPGLEPVTAPAGTFVAVPPNVIHGFDNDATERASFLNFHAPSGGFADYMRGVSPGFDSFEPPADGGGPAAEATSPCPERESSSSGHQLPLDPGCSDRHLAAMVMSFEPGFEGVAPHSHDRLRRLLLRPRGHDGVHGNGTAARGRSSPLRPRRFTGFDPGRRSTIVLLNVHAPDADFVARRRADQ